MFEPKFLCRLRPSEDNTTCLGSQLVTIVDFLRAELITHVWYAADVDALSDLPRECGVDTRNLAMIGADESLIAFSKKIHQFIWGVFIAIDSQSGTQSTSNVEVSTEDEEYRSLHLDGILVEIRTFDTSYFEVYSENEPLMRRLAARFVAEIEEARRGAA